MVKAKIALILALSFSGCATLPAGVRDLTFNRLNAIMIIVEAMDEVLDCPLDLAERVGHARAAGACLKVAHRAN
jgi:hypothetical protein